MGDSFPQSEITDYLATLGWGYYKQGKYTLAVEALEKADDLVPKYDHVVRQHLEMAQAALAQQK